jgi:2-polyprenyl-3-methyl-5-hydroxy-6-metoxy-1,4-benzoquinol methylase
MDPRYSAIYRRLYDEHWWWRARGQFIVAELRRRIAGPGHRILDVGCGNGLLFDRLAPFGEVEGVEVDAAAAGPGGRHRDRIFVGPFDHRFQPGRSYSVILMLDFIEHLADPLPALRRALELLDDDGIVLVTVPAFPSLWTSHDDLNRHFLRYTKRSFELLAGSAGMRIVDWRYFFHWVHPVKLLVRARERLAPSPPAPPSIPPAPLNAILFHLSRLEQIVFRRLPLPFGNSLFVLGCRGEGSEPRVPR